MSTAHRHRHAARRLGAAVLCLLPLLAGACERSATPDGDRPAEQALLFYCGAGMSKAATELAEAFRDETGVTVMCDFAGSGSLISRIKTERKGDLYMPGDVYYVDELDRQTGLVESKRMVTYFVPAIVVRKGNPKNIRSLADLARPGLRVGLGNPDACQIGRITRKIFEKNALDQAAINRNVVMAAMTVNELPLWIKTDSIDATVAWDAVAAQADFADATEIVPIPADRNIVSRVAVAVLTCSENIPLAGKFADFLAAPTGQAIFRKHHYRTEPPER